MNRNEVLNSIALKKRFCKDCNLPIAVFDNPYFYERLCTLDVLEDCINKFDLFCEELEQFNSEQDYFEYYNESKEPIIEYIKNSPEYDRFINESFKCDFVANKRNLYVQENDGRGFISIDMQKANFSAMKHYSSELFFDDETWEEFVCRFAYSQHIISSKYIRQVVFGTCNPKKQIQYEHYLMNILCEHIIKELPDISIYSLGVDEIIISIPDGGCGFSLNKLKSVVNSCRDGIGLLVRIDAFTLNDINVGWIKTYYDSSERIEFKCVDAEVYHQVVKHYFGIPITENDLVFRHNGKLAKFLCEVDNPWS